ncbi:hypothetical protein, partial [Prevotella sp.]|uniref:hypothetical protein n=1 Tax=Prevotella sp. TaxID=59823 RepID=UPI0027E361A4
IYIMYIISLAKRLTRRSNMDKTKLTREEALKRWKASKELKRKMSEKLERLVRESCKDKQGTDTVSIEIW